MSESPVRESIDKVVAFYDAHPINEEQIMHALAVRNISLDAVTEDILKEHDQDHFGGLEANDILIAAAGFRKGQRILDVCSGMGGPARYLAHRAGCEVVGLDFTESRHLGAQRLTKLTKLDHLVSHRHGNALDMPFANASFDGAMGQEAWCHVPEKPRLIAECARVVKAGGVIAFTDILRTDKLSDAEMARLREEMTFPTLESLDGYATLLRNSGCSIERRDDLGAQWAQILIARLAMYRSLRADTERKFGASHFRKWDDTYAFFVGLYGEGKLTGGRFIARKT